MAPALRAAAGLSLMLPLTVTALLHAPLSRPASLGSLHHRSTGARPSSAAASPLAPAALLGAPRPARRAAARGARNAQLLPMAAHPTWQIGDPDPVPTPLHRRPKWVQNTFMVRNVVLAVLAVHWLCHIARNLAPVAPVVAPYFAVLDAIGNAICGESGLLAGQ